MCGASTFTCTRVQDQYLWAGLSKYWHWGIAYPVAFFNRPGPAKRDIRRTKSNRLTWNHREQRLRHCLLCLRFWFNGCEVKKICQMFFEAANRALHREHRSVEEWQKSCARFNDGCPVHWYPDWVQSQLWGVPYLAPVHLTLVRRFPWN